MEKETEKIQKLKKTENSVVAKTTKKGASKKWITIGLIVIVAFVGFRYFSARNRASVKREAFETQRQVMIAHWEGQGLSDEEIQLKLEDLRQERIDSGERSSGTGIMRILGGGHSMRR